MIKCDDCDAALIRSGVPNIEVNLQEANDENGEKIPGLPIKLTIVMGMVKPGIQGINMIQTIDLCATCTKLRMTQVLQNPEVARGLPWALRPTNEQAIAEAQAKQQPPATVAKRVETPPAPH